jgi:hypothetical protein
MKTVLLIPGFQEDLDTRDYASLIMAIESEGFTVVFVPINWVRTTITDWVKQAGAEYAKYDPQQTILAGFSYGSMTAFVLATQRNPSALWLFSLSPYFSDDIPKLKQSWKNGIGKRRVAAFSTLDFKTLVTLIDCQTLIIAGEVENQKYPLLKKRSEVAHTLIKNSIYSIAPGADHDVGDKNYIATIVSATKL